MLILMTALSTQRVTVLATLIACACTVRADWEWGTYDAAIEYEGAIVIGTIATLALLIPVAAVAVNLHKTLRGRWSVLRHDVALRFVVLGGLAYTAASLQDAAQALPAVDAFTHFPQCGVAQAHLGLYGFFTMVMCGAIYHILPRMSGRTAPPRHLAEVHFWCATSGLVLYWLGLMGRGLVQGWAARDPGAPFTDVLANVVPFFGVRSAAGYLMLTGHLAFAGCVLQLLAARREVRA